jgi:hypothetical protein
MAKRPIAPSEQAVAVRGCAMSLSDYLRRQAELCIAISRATFDLTMAGRLRDMASDLQEKAVEVEDEMASIPPHIINGKTASEGQRDRG